MRSLDCYRAVPVAENTPQFADKETYDAVVLMRPDLPRLASNDRLKPTAEEAMAIALGTIAYFGTYTVDEASKAVSLKIDGTTLVNQLGSTRSG